MSDTIPSSWWRLIWRYLRPQAAKASAMTVLLLASTALQLLSPQIVSVFLDDAQRGATPTRLTWLAAGFIAAALLNQGVAAWSTYLSQDVAWTSTNVLREDLARHSLALDSAFLALHPPGEFIERIDGDLTKLATFFSDFVVKVLGSALLLLGVVVLLFRADWRLGLAMAIFTVVTVVALQISRVPAIRAGIAQRTASANFYGFIEEHLASAEDLRANGGGAYAMRQFLIMVRGWFFVQRRAAMLRTVTWWIALGCFTFSYILVFGLGGSLYVQGVITLGTVYLFFQYNEMLQTPLEYLSRQMQQFQDAAAGVARIAELAGARPTILDRDATAAPPAGPLSVAFHHVSFAYHPDDGPVLRDLDFSLPPGGSLGLLGRTGSGKTTISRLLFRLYDHSAGEIRLGGVPLGAMPLAALRRRIGLVTQDVQIFHASVRDNLTFFDPAIPDARIHEVIATMGLAEWFARLPHGLDTPLAAGGAGLSAGEAQLLAFIRVFLRDPGLVILDEPTSRLDPATERQIERGMRALLRGRTAIIIAHRLATVRLVDQIMVLEDGAIAEVGPRDRLASDPRSRFAALLRVGLEEALA